MKNLKNTKGITLIALIITIIVLLILAGVTIATLTGDNGLLSKTAGAKEENFKGEEREKIVLGFNEYRIKKYTDANPQLTVEGATSVAPKDGGGWTVTFPSERVYEVEENGTITGGETANLPEDSVVSLAKSGEIQRGDKINYNPGTATTASINLPKGASIEGKKLASINLPVGATIEGTINASDASDWVVLDANQTTGEVLIMPKTFSDVGLKLEGMDGYNNSIEAINAVASIYKNPTQANLARGITYEDIGKVCDYTPSDPKEITFNHRYGIDNNLKIVDAGEGNAPSRTFTYEKKYYSGDPNFGFFGFGGSGGEYWIATQELGYLMDSNNQINWVTTDVPYYNYGTIMNARICEIGRGTNYLNEDTAGWVYCFPVRPVVQLKLDAELVNEGEVQEVATATGNQDAGPRHIWSFK